MSRSLIALRGIAEPFLTVMLVSHFEVVQLGLIPRQHREHAHMCIMDLQVSEVTGALWGHTAKVYDLLTEIQGEVCAEKKIVSLGDHTTASDLHQQLCLMAKATKFGNYIFGLTPSSLHKKPARRL